MPPPMPPPMGPPMSSAAKASAILSSFGAAMPDGCGLACCCACCCCACCGFVACAGAGTGAGAGAGGASKAPNRSSNELAAAGAGAGAGAGAATGAGAADDLVPDPGGALNAAKVAGWEGAAFREMRTEGRPVFTAAGAGVLKLAQSSSSTPTGSGCFAACFGDASCQSTSNASSSLARGALRDDFLSRLLFFSLLSRLLSSRRSLLLPSDGEDLRPCVYFLATNTSSISSRIPLALDGAGFRSGSKPRMYLLAA